jgi:hypothetical protein
LQKLGKTVGKETRAQKTDVERFTLNKKSEMEVRKEYQIKIPNSLGALEGIDDSKDINRA